MAKKNWVLSNRLIGQLMFLLLFVLSLVFYLERTLFVDPCYAVFNLLYYRDYVIEAGRVAAVAPQTLVLLAIKMHLSLKSILMIYSVSFVLLYYIIYLVITYIFRLDRLALAVPLVLMLGVKFTWFWISTETQQALVYTVFFYAFLTWSDKFKPGMITWLARIVISAGLLLLCFYSHPVSLFTVLFVLGFHVLDSKLWLRPDGYILGGIIVALSVYKFLTGSSVGYESFFFKGFGEFFNRLGDIRHSESLKYLNAHLFNIYLFSLILFLLTTGWYIARRMYLKLAYYLLALVLFSLVLFNTFNIWFFPFIQEKNLMPLNIFLLIPFLNDVKFIDDRKKIILQMILILAFLLAVFHLAEASSFYRGRVAYVKNLIRASRNFPEKKFIIGEKIISREQIGVNWGLAPETLILSSLAGPDSSVSIYINDESGRIGPEINLRDTLLFICAPWAKDLEIRRLDRRYFNLSNSVYRTLTEMDMVTGKEVSFYTNGFDDPKYCSGKQTCMKDSTGNTFYVLNDEFSPGVYGKYTDLTSHPAILVSSSVRVFPMEPLNSKWLNLVISKEQNQVVLDYHRSGLDKPSNLELNRWNTLTVSGVVRSSDPGDLLKIYLWNPEKKHVGMDDLKVTYRLLLR